LEALPSSTENLSRKLTPKVAFDKMDWKLLPSSTENLSRKMTPKVALRFAGTAWLEKSFLN